MTCRTQSVRLSSPALYDAALMAKYVANFGSQKFGDTVSNFTKECSPPSCGAHYVEEEVNEFGAPFGFFHETIAGHQDGFAVFLDVNQVG
jgi:hypothetical protein